MLRTDLIGWLLLLLLGALALVAGATLIEFAHLSLLGAAVGLLILVAVLKVGLPDQVRSTPKNMLVHGAARVATEQEAKMAARTGTKAPNIHDQQFPD